jgi:hypothetical protein
MTTRTRLHGRAFTIGHMLFALVLLSAFAVAAARVFRQSVLTTRTAADGQERSIRLQQALRTLRADVWQATAIDAVEPTQLRLTTPDTPVQWRADVHATRTAGKETQSWTDLPLRFEKQGSAILVRDKDNLLAVLERGGAK